MDLGESSNSLPVSSNTLIIKPEYQGDLTKEYGSRSIRMHIEDYLGYFKPSESNFTFEITMSGRGNPQPSADAAIHSLFNRCHTRDGTNTHLLEEVLQYNSLCAQTMQYSKTEASVNDRSMFQGLSESKAADGSLYWALAGGTLWTNHQMVEPPVARNVQICTPIKTKLYSTPDYICLQAFNGLRLEFLLDDYRRSLEYQTGVLGVNQVGAVPGYPATIFDSATLAAAGTEEAQPQFDYSVGTLGVGYQANHTYSLSSAAGVIGWIKVDNVSTISTALAPASNLLLAGPPTTPAAGAPTTPPGSVATTCVPAATVNCTVTLTFVANVLTVAVVDAVGSGYAVGGVITVAQALIPGATSDLVFDALVAGNFAPAVGGHITAAEMYCLGSTGDIAPVVLPKPGDVLTVGLPSGVPGAVQQQISFAPFTNVSGKGSVASYYTNIEVPLWSGTASELISKFKQAALVIAANLHGEITQNFTGATNGPYPGLATLSDGAGSGALVDVTVAGNVCSAVVVSAGGGGFGYLLGDTLTVPKASITGASHDLVITLSAAASLGYQSTWIASPPSLATTYGDDTVANPTRDVARAASAASGAGLCFPGAIMPFQVGDRLYFSTSQGHDQEKVGVIAGIELYLDGMPRLLVRPDRALQPSPANDAVWSAGNVVTASQVWTGNGYAYHNLKNGMQWYVSNEDRLEGYSFDEGTHLSNALPASVLAAANSKVDFLIKNFEYQLKRVEVDPAIAAADAAACNSEKGLEIDLETTACRLVNQAQLVGPAQQLVSIPNVTRALGVLSVPIPQGANSLHEHNLRGVPDGLGSYQYEIGGKLCPNRAVNVLKASLPNPLHGAWESMEKIKCLESFGMSCTNLNRIPSFSVGRSFARPGMTFNLMAAGDLQLKTQYDVPQTSAKLFVHYLNHIRMINCNKNGLRISN